MITKINFLKYRAANKILIILIFLSAAVFAGSASHKFSNYCDRVHRNCTCDTNLKHEYYNTILKCFGRTFYILLKNRNMEIICDAHTHNYTTFEKLLPKSVFETLDELTLRECNEVAAMPTKNLMASLRISKVDFFRFVINLHILRQERNIDLVTGPKELKLHIFDGDIDTSIFASYANLTAVQLFSNELFELPENFFKTLTNVRKVLLRNIKLCNLTTKLLQELKLENLSIEFADVQRDWTNPNCSALTLNSMGYLVEAHLVNTFEDHIHGDYFRESHSLRSIYIINNPNLKNLPLNLFEDQTDLTTLDLHSNGLLWLQADLFKNNRKIRILNLSYNKLKSLSRVFAPLSGLELLNLGFNRNLHFRMDYFKWNALKLIDLDGVPETGIFYKTKVFLCYTGDSCKFSYDTNGKLCPFECDCWLERKTLRFIIDCRNRKLQRIPELPIPILGNLTLHIDNNNLTQLPTLSSYGYANISELYISGNKLTQLEVKRIPPEMMELDIRNNKLQSLSKDIMRFLEQRKEVITLRLAGNPWACDCEARYLVRFVNRLSAKIKDIDKLGCGHPKFTKTIVEIDEIEICKSLVVPISIAAMFLIFVLTVILVAYKQELKIWLYEHDLCLRIVTEDDLDKEKIYDAFISYSHKDEYLVHKLLPKLESGERSYKICLHERDWLVGDCIPERIARSVADSKRIIILLTPNFLNSVWGRMEFRMAYHASMEDRRKRLIIILCEEIENFNAIDNELKAYLKLNTYLKWNDPHFWRKMYYAMPHKYRTAKEVKSAQREIELEMEQKLMHTVT